MVRLLRRQRDHQRPVRPRNAHLDGVSYKRIRTVVHVGIIGLRRHLREEVPDISQLHMNRRQHAVVMEGLPRHDPRIGIPLVDEDGALADFEPAQARFVGTYQRRVILDVVDLVDRVRLADHVKHPPSARRPKHCEGPGLPFPRIRPPEAKSQCNSRARVNLAVETGPSELPHKHRHRAHRRVGVQLRQRAADSTAVMLFAPVVRALRKGGEGELPRVAIGRAQERRAAQVIHGLCRRQTPRASRHDAGPLDRHHKRLSSVGMRLLPPVIEEILTMQGDLMNLPFRQQIKQPHVKAEAVYVLEEVAAFAQEGHGEDGISPRKHHLHIGAVALLHANRVLSAREIAGSRVQRQWIAAAELRRRPATRRADSARLGPEIVVFLLHQAELRPGDIALPIGLQVGQRLLLVSSVAARLSVSLADVAANRRLLHRQRAGGIPLGIDGAA